MKKIFFSFLIILSTSLFSSSLFSADRADSRLPTANKVDIARYIGKWYSISALPQFFTRNCIAQTAEYGILNESSISVLNTCYKENGKTTDIKGKAVVVDSLTNARLEVTFDNFFTRLFGIKGEYVIIKLSDGYDTVLVGTTDRKSLWIMARTPSLDADVFNEYKKNAFDLGFPVDKLVDSKF
jgi:apolipoprotein D and lipocalin family protein